MKICLIRLDKIGDLVSTLPVDQIPELQGHDVTWVINEGLGFLPKHSNPERKFIEISATTGSQKFQSFLQEVQPDLAVVFYAPWWVSKDLWSAKISRRFGRKSQWHSFLFLNEGLRQKRSLSQRHEADYNLELLLAALRSHSRVHQCPLLKLQAFPSRHLFEKYELRSQGYFVVHPGMAGSAHNWANKNYVALIELLKNEKEVVITGTKIDEPWLTPLKEKFAGDSRVQILQDQLGREELLFILQNSAGVVAPSTGVAHLAASLGAPLVSLFPEDQKMHPTRWAPRGEKVKILSPLDSISPAQVMECLKTL